MRSVQLCLRPESESEATRSSCSRKPEELHLRHLSEVVWNEKSLTGHIEQIHSNEKKHKCLICGKAFSLKSSLRVHTKKVRETRGKSFGCDICGNKYYERWALRNHISVILENKCEDVDQGPLPSKHYCS